MADMNSTAWLVRTGEGGAVLPECLDANVAALRYETVSDARTTSHDTMVEQLASTGQRVQNNMLIGLLEQFRDEVRHGDLIVTPHAASRDVFLAEVTGDYDYRDPSPVPGYSHLRPVRWFGTLDRDLDVPSDRLVQMDRQPVFYELPDADWWVAAAKRVDGGPIPLKPRRPSRGPSANRAPALVYCETCEIMKPAAAIVPGGCRDCM